MNHPLEVRIVRLAPLRVASFHSYGASPEADAWQKLARWVEENQMLGAGVQRRIFGFNNPSPSAGSPNYGYEFWIELPEAAEAHGVPTRQFNGGLYAVTRCRGIDAIGPTWQALAAWCEQSRFRIAHHQWLEEHLGGLAAPIDGLELDLFLPVADEGGS